MSIVAIDHVQLSLPPGGEGAARTFYAKVLGLMEVPKPATLAKRGGVWFASGTVRIHLGVETDFRPARRAHPALRVNELDDLARRLRSHGYEPQFDADLPGYARFYVSDPFGNRLEFLEPVASAGSE